eukprot:13962-Heterococcus_DN1.PRE.1
MYIAAVVSPNRCCCCCSTCVCVHPPFDVAFKLVNSLCVCMSAAAAAVAAAATVVVVVAADCHERNTPLVKTPMLSLYVCEVTGCSTTAPYSDASQPSAAAHSRESHNTPARRAQCCAAPPKSRTKSSTQRCPVQHSGSTTAATTAAAVAAAGAAAADTAVAEALYKLSERLLVLIEKGLGSRAAAFCLKHEKKRRSPGNKTIQVQLLLRLFPLFCMCVCDSTAATAEPAAIKLHYCCYENC